MEGRTTPQPAGGRPADPERRRKVLITEDDEDVRAVFAMALGDDFEVSSAETGMQALALVESFRPDVMLLDWTLPDLTGEEVVGKLRSMKTELASTPVVIVSGAASVRTLADRLGAVACPKPCSVEQLVAAIGRALANR